MFFSIDLEVEFPDSNAHIRSLSLSCASLKAFLITFLLVETHHTSTVRRARVTSKITWTAVITESFISLGASNPYHLLSRHPQTSFAVAKFLLRTHKTAEITYLSNWTTFKGVHHKSLL
jgi:hypothetical protein